MRSGLTRDGTAEPVFRDQITTDSTFIIRKIRNDCYTNASDVEYDLTIVGRRLPGERGVFMLLLGVVYRQYSTRYSRGGLLDAVQSPNAPLPFPLDISTWSIISHEKVSREKQWVLFCTLFYFIFSVPRRLGVESFRVGSQNAATRGFVFAAYDPSHLSVLTFSPCVGC